MSETLTPEQEQELRRVKAYFPFRIVWGTFEEDEGGNRKFGVYADLTKRRMNKYLREGQRVFTTS